MNKGQEWKGNDMDMTAEEVYELIMADREHGTVVPW